MTGKQTQQQSSNAAAGKQDDFQAHAPSISLPKGGGAVRGIGEKFSTNPVTGAGSLSVPLASSPARSGFGPQLALSYDSGSGNGAFGIGWNLSLPAITRKTDKGLPRYFDADESDVFLLSGAEDLVPLLQDDGSRLVDNTTLPGYTIYRYRPRVEGLFARIERWHRDADGDIHWRSISKDNILSVYGRDGASRIADPSHPQRVFTWLLCESYDDKGNAIVYGYLAENDDNVDFSHINERNRLRSANRYLKTIRYGNRQPLLIDPNRPSFRQAHLPAPDFSSADWMFEMLFDYGEGHYSEAPKDADGRIFANASLPKPLGGKWAARLDPFSSYRSCFEVRSYRLCQRVLMFHHFPDELGIDDYLVRATEFFYQPKANGSFMTHVLQSGFKRLAKPTPRYLKRALPPLEFSYSASPLDDGSFDQLPLQEVARANLQNLPAGIDGGTYRWVDLDGEGIAGVLTEQADAWFYKPNLGAGRFGPVHSVAPRPSMAALARGRQQLLDLAGDGKLDLVEFDGPAAGYFSRKNDHNNDSQADAGWDRFRNFVSLPNINWQDPNLRFVDLTGDGHADILITDDQVFATWYESKAQDGFAAGVQLPPTLDEESGPRLVFADGAQSIYLADMVGDGLSDLVRIRASDVCYWPNLGYGRFGAKVRLDNVPWFDAPTEFEQHRVHLFDTDGSGPTDIVYLGRDGVRVYQNQHGNSLSPARLLTRVPRTDQLSNVSVVDFLGRGTACLLWSSTLPGESGRSLRYMDLMGGVKPHLLTSVRNNLGLETRIEYASSTQFYLADKAQGTPWITRLPFPVHVVTRVETRDLISGNRFASSTSYHHGYYDGIEREFRGFGRVEQTDSEQFGNAFDVPATLTKTWFHTGAFLANARIARQFASEYYHEGDPGQPGTELTSAQRAAMELDDTILPPGLDTLETAEAIRALKGAMLRQEIYALDDKEESDRPYSVTEQNYTVVPVQQRGSNRHAVFFTHMRETLAFHYERKLFPVLQGHIVDAATAAANPATQWLADPRVTHGMALAVDDYGNVLQAVALAYGRRFDDADPALTAQDRAKQKQLLATLTEAGFTNSVQHSDAWRTPMPAQTRTYELVKLKPAAQLAHITNLFGFAEMQALIAQAGDGAHDLLYEDFQATSANGIGVYRRPIEVQRSRYRSNDLSQVLPLQTLQALALPGESWQLAFTPGLLVNVFQRTQDGEPPENLLPNPAAVLLYDASPQSDRGGYVDLDGDGHWWIPSGRAFFHPLEDASAADELQEAAAHFFMPRRVRDPFGHSSFVDYENDLFPATTRDALGNTVSAVYDYRVLQAQQMTDPNGNRSFIAFDAFGLPVASAVRGKSDEMLGDSLDDFGDVDADPTLAELQAFAANPPTMAAALLKGATSRFIYDLERFNRCGAPPFAATLARDTHVSDPLPPQGVQIQVSFLYSDGFGRELQSKIQAEAGQAATRAANLVLPSGDASPGALMLNNALPVLGPVSPRWVGKGRTVYNNKGKPVKQYEPFFSSTHLYEPESEMTDTGVTPILFYDPADRVVATLHPNHSYEKVVFDPWRQASWDVNDTVTQSNPMLDPDVGDFFQLLPDDDYLPTWFEQRNNGQLGPNEKDAAAKAAFHANTPTVAFFDTLGRVVLTIADNGKDGNKLPQLYATRVVFDIEGNQREVIDANHRIVMRYGYDMLGHGIHQASMEAGQRWSLGDISGKPIHGWDNRKHSVRTEYDVLRRPVASFVIGADLVNPALEICFEKTVYGETANDLTPAQVLQANLRGKPYQHFDTAGVVTSVVHDFKGNLLKSTRQLVQDYKTTPDWSAKPAPLLEGEVFAGSTVFDALNRPIQMLAPHHADGKINVIRPGYNEANLLERVDVWLAQDAEPFGLLAPATANLHAIANIDYDAKGQRARVEYGNGALTEYGYDPQTFRLVQLKTTRKGVPAQKSVLQDLVYFYDPVGNITHIRDDAQQAIFFNGQVVLPECDYSYDPIYRLIKASGREHIGQLAQPQTSWSDEFRLNLPQPGDGQAMRNYTEQYLYDAVGNFEQLIHQAQNGAWTRKYQYNEASLVEPAKKSNRLSGTSVGALNEPYAHDAHGNMTSMPHLTLMQWDFKDQLRATSRQVSNSEPPPDKVAETTFYLYDGGGERVRKVTERQNGTRKNERIYLGGFEVFRAFKANGSDIELERETLHVMDDEHRIALVEMRTQGDDETPQLLIRFQLDNHLGSASIELNDQGEVISYEEYYPYGSTSYQAVEQEIKKAGKRYRYIGKERDEETGFSYHSARYYVPWIGRWSAADPSGLTDGLNLFIYVNNKPLVAIDLNGKWLHVVVGAAVGALVGGFLELGRQLIAGNGISWRRIGAATIGGAAGGAIAGATFGASLGIEVAGVVGGAAIGGSITRAIQGDRTTISDVVIDVGISLLTFGVLRGGSTALNRFRSRKQPDTTNPKGSNFRERATRSEIPPVPKAKPPEQYGNNTSKFGKDIGWGAKLSKAESRANGRVPTLESLNKIGATREILEQWRTFYRYITKYHPGNPSAPGRAEFLDEVLNRLYPSTVPAHAAALPAGAAALPAGLQSNNSENSSVFQAKNPLAPQLSMPILDAIRTLGRDSTTSGQQQTCNYSGLALCATRQGDFTEPRRLPAYNPDTNSTTILRLRF